MDRRSFERTAQSCVVPVVVVTATKYLQVGTAFCVSPSGIWITARHNLEGRMSAEEYLAAHRDSYLAILWVGPAESFRVPIPVASNTGHPQSGSDLAVLKIGPSEFRFPSLRLSAFLPPKGTPICALGYPEFEIGDGSISPDLKVSTGQVSNVYVDGRDTFRDLDGNFSGDLPTASFETTAQIDHAMSGGPVLNSSGSVVGVISKGFDRTVDTEPDTSYMSATPYIFMLNVAYSPDNKVSIYELARRRIVTTDDSFAHLRMTDIDNELRVFYAGQ